MCLKQKTKDKKIKNNMQKFYKVQIEEVIQRIVYIKADSEEKALSIAKERI